MAAPTVTAVNPVTGSTSGGTTVTVTGTNFTTATSVKFDATNASFTVFSATTIYATSPAHAAGAVYVTVVNPDGTSATGPSSVFTYETPTAPTITSLTPNTGSTAGGTVVTIKGTNLSAVSAVDFGGTPGTGIVLVDSQTVRVTSPAHAAGAVNVTVTTPSGTSAPATYTYTTPPAPPTVTGLSFTTGTTLGGTSLTITGTNLTGATAVRFGATAAILWTVVNATTITVTSPAHAAGAVNVTVTTPGGTSAAAPANQYTYVGPPPPGGGLAAIVEPPPPPPDRNREMRVLLYNETMSNTPQVFTRGFTVKAFDPANSIGTISFTLPYLDDSDAAADVTVGKVVKVQVLNASNTYVDAYLGRIEGINTKTIAATRGDRRRSFSARGLAADFEKTRIYPHGGVGRIPWGDQRTFGWAAPELDTTSWPAVDERSIQGDRTAVPPNGLAAFPYTWPNPLSYWLWGQTPVSGTHDPAGVNYFQYRFSTTQELDVSFFVTADDLFVAALDGIPLINFTEVPSDAADKTYGRKIRLPAGDHCFAVKAENLPRPGIPDNCGLINVVAMYDTAPGDLLFTGGYETRRYLFTTVGVNVNTPQLATQLQVWKASAYPATPPGMTPGKILSILFTEAQARGELPGWALGFTTTVDSNGAGWAGTVPDFAMDVGQSLLDCLNKLTADGWIDWAIDTSTMTLDVWPQGARAGSAPSAVFAEGSNIEQLEHDEKWGGYRGKLLVRWSDGFTEVGSGQYGDFLSVADAVDLTEAARRGQITLDHLDDDSTGIVMVGRPLNDAQTPWIGFTVGSGITVPAPDGTPTEYVVTTIGASEMDSTGRITWDIQLVSRRRVAEERLAKIADRALPGGLSGRTNTVVPASASQPAGQVLELDELIYNLSGSAADADAAAVAAGFTEARSGPTRANRRLKLQRATLEAAGGTTGSSIVDFYVDGHLTITMFLVGASLYAVDHFGSGSGNWFIEINQAQKLTVRLRNNPGDHDGLVFRVFGSPLL